MRVIARTFYPHSPGEFWEAITVLCGFHHMKHGGKITGLAAYDEEGTALGEVAGLPVFVGEGREIATLILFVFLAELFDASGAGHSVPQDPWQDGRRDGRRYTVLTSEVNQK